MTDPGQTSAASRRDALVDKLFAGAIGALELLSVYLGDRLGLYRALAERPGATPAELATVAGVHERYAREWLEQQTVSGILETENPDAGDDQRRYRIPAGHDEALIDESSLDFIAPLAQAVVGCTPPLAALADAFRTGEGVPYAAYGRDASESQARGTRALYEKKLTTEWLPAVPALHARLQGGPPPASRTWRAATAIRRSRSRVGIRSCASTGLTLTRPRSPRRAECWQVAG
jgi:hypothetical protein